MFSHQDIWDAIDRLALYRDSSPSGLARQAGLDPTAFNKSKRRSSSGKPRWPSTESLSKVLLTVGMSFEEFARFTNANIYEVNEPTVPLIGLAQTGNEGFFDDAGFPVGASWEDINLPTTKDENVYALQISGESMSPVLRDGDKVLVAPNETVRRGDRVVVKTCDGEIMAKELQYMSDSSVALTSLNPDFKDRVLNRKDVLWVARIIWVSQ
ncbi:MAG: helix-turn-helix transcriptional regulator [Litorimonas sp.]